MSKGISLVTVLILILVILGAGTSGYILTKKSSEISVTTSTATTTILTTTIPELLDCPIECCVNMRGYKDKLCPADQECRNNNMCRKRTYKLC
jgi:hypothetical protein